jgi:TPR repeat protein
MAMMVQYSLKDEAAEGYVELMKYVKDAKTKADAGDARSQLLYGLLAEGLPQMTKSRKEAMPSILKAAQSGIPIAQFMVGYRALQGWGCECDEPKALIWLHKAAASDQGDAQVVLAHYLLRGEPTAEQIAQAFVWLELAATNDNTDGKFYLAALLAAGVDPARRDAQRALMLLKEVMEDREVDPAAFEIRAAARAAIGDFVQARKDQERALKMAQKFGWETASQ